MSTTLQLGKVDTVVSGIEDPVVVGHGRVDDGYWSARRNAGQRWPLC